MLNVVGNANSHEVHATRRYNGHPTFDHHAARGAQRARQVRNSASILPQSPTTFRPVRSMAPARTCMHDPLALSVETVAS
ncbi:hypothetical protein [Lysobacter claricitrinus]|uniref:hypothetical protein n=1 Tax=Lysobacter claricitrinus TaxID=3367728 RepID=UPI0038B31544